MSLAVVPDASASFARRVGERRAREGEGERERGPSEAGSFDGAGALTQVLSGLTVSLAMVPESLAFTFVAGVSPIVGLHAAALMGLATALFGRATGGHLRSRRSDGGGGRTARGESWR